MTHSYSRHLAGTETVRTSEDATLDALYIETPLSHTPSTGLLLGHHIAPADRIRFLRELAEAASDLADEINLRDLEESA